jgi:ABC-type iron transport system FetAB ATPase subunit
VQKLLEVDLAIPILIHLFDCTLQLLLRVEILELFTAQQRADLTCIDLSRVVLVKHLECSAQVLILQESCSVHRRRQKFYNISY